MADTAISALAAAAALADPDLLTIVQGGINKRITARLLARYIGDALHNESFAAAQSVPASATTYLTGSPITIPTGERVAVGTWVRWNYHLTKTAAGTLANSDSRQVGHVRHDRRRDAAHARVAGRHRRR
jgi:hypothetical protein